MYSSFSFPLQILAPGTLTSPLHTRRLIPLVMTSLIQGSTLKRRLPGLVTPHPRSAPGRDQQLAGPILATPSVSLSS